MEKQLNVVHDEALKDLDQIFDTIMVGKILNNAKELHQVQKDHLIKIEKIINGQINSIENIDLILKKLGTISNSLLDEIDDPDDFQEKNGKYSISSVLAGTSGVSLESNQKIKGIEKVIGSFPHKDSDGITSNSMSELLQFQYDQEISLLKEILVQIRTYETTIQSVNTNIMQAIEYQQNTSKDYFLDLETVLKREFTELKKCIDQRATLNQQHMQGAKSIFERKEKISITFNTLIFIGIIVSIVLQLT